VDSRLRLSAFRTGSSRPGSRTRSQYDGCGAALASTATGRSLISPRSGRGAHLSQLGALRDSETSSVYVGFMPALSDTIRQKMQTNSSRRCCRIKAKTIGSSYGPCVFRYAKLAGRAEPVRQSACRPPVLMIEKHTSGKLPTLEALSFRKSTTLDKLKGMRHRSVISSLATKTPNRRLEATSGSARHPCGALFCDGIVWAGGRRSRMLPGRRIGRTRQAHCRQHGEIHPREQLLP